MASAITKKQQQQKESIYDTINKRVKALLSEEVTSVSPFAKELYKTIRGKVKKLDDIKKIEEMTKGGQKINEDQAEKLKNKEPFITSVQLSLDAFEVYKKAEFASLQQSKQQPEQPEAPVQPSAVPEEAKKT